jgi:dipeptidase D
MSVLSGLEPQLLWKFFDEIRKIPHPSGSEEKLAEYVISLAKKQNLDYTQDEVGNVVIRKPATPGHEKSPAIVLQSHLDMVGEKNSDKEFDFETQAIDIKVDGEWLTADGTTLGSDNGVGIAAALAILHDDSLVHGPIEALFTIDEERGLVGAQSLSPDLLKGRKMINMDSEEIGVFSIGCAGGADSHITLPVQRKPAEKDTLVRIHLYGLRGGHSGIDIHEGRGNALKILTRLLFQVHKQIPLELHCLNGGDKHNAIPREATAQVAIQKSQVADLEKWFDVAIKDVRIEFEPLEKNISIAIDALDTQVPAVMELDSQNTFLGLIFALPHGPLAWSKTIKGLVETSNNVASIKCAENQIKIHLSSRSSNQSALQATLDKLVAITHLADGAIEQPPGYPGWRPNLDSEILQVALQAYKEVADKEASYEAIHAGLECGLIGEKYSGMDMISVGPTIKHPHSPDERVHIGSVDLFYKHVVRMLEKLA